MLSLATGLPSNVDALLILKLLLLEQMRSPLAQTTELSLPICSFECTRQQTRHPRQKIMPNILMPMFQPTLTMLIWQVTLKFLVIVPISLFDQLLLNSCLPMDL